jgi:hypothetical protein
MIIFIFISSLFSNSDCRERGNIFSIVTSLKGGRSGFRTSAEARDFSLFQNVQTGSGAHKISSLVDTGGYFPGVKRQGRDVDHSLPSSASVKSEWAIPLLILYDYMA